MIRDSSGASLPGTRSTRSTSARPSEQSSEAKSPRRYPGRASDVGLQGAAAAAEADGRAQERSVTPRQTRGLHELAKPLLQGQLGGATATKARLETIRRALANNAVHPDSWNGPGRPLSAAVQAGHMELTQVLLAAQASVNWSDARGVSALHLAVFDGRVDLCDVLIQAGADPNCRDQHGQTPLFFAPQPDVCRLLAEGMADINALNGKGHSALHLARHAGLNDVVSWLLEHMSHTQTPALTAGDTIGKDIHTSDSGTTLLDGVAGKLAPDTPPEEASWSHASAAPARQPAGEASAKNDYMSISIASDEASSQIAPKFAVEAAYDALHPQDQSGGNAFPGVSPVPKKALAARQSEPHWATEGADSDEDLIEFCRSELLVQETEDALRRGSRGSKSDGDRRISDGSLVALPTTSELCEGAPMLSPTGATDQDTDEEDVASAAPQGADGSDSLQPELPTTSELAASIMVQESW